MFSGHGRCPATNVLASAWRRLGVDDVRKSGNKLSSAVFALFECDVLFVCLQVHVDRCLSIRVCSVGVLCRVAFKCAACSRVVCVFMHA